MEMTVTVVGDQALLQAMSGLQGFFHSQKLRVVLEDAKNALIRLASQKVPKDSRFLKASISGQVEDFGTSNPRVRVGTSARYAPYVEEGTKPHQIRPRTKRSLFWVTYNTPKTRARLGQAGAVFTFASKVNHPGTQAQPFMTPAYVAVKPRLLKAITRLLAEEMKARGGAGGPPA